MRLSTGIGLSLVGLGLLVPRWFTPYQVTFLLQLAMLIALAQSWNLMSGMTGYVSFGHAVFFGIGAYTGVLLLLAGVPWWLGIAAAALLTLVLALPMGLLTLRLRGPYFAIAMLGLNEVGRIVATLWTGLTRGGDGIALTPTLLPPLSTAYYTMLLLAVTATMVMVIVLRHRCGLDLRAIRGDEGAADMFGVNTALNKIVAFMVSAVVPGAVGAVYAMYTSFIDPISVFAPGLNVGMIVMVLLGGRGTVWGPVIGAAIVMSIHEFTWVQFPALHLALLGVLLIVVVLYVPDGIVAIMSQRQRLRLHQYVRETLRNVDETR